MDGTTVSTFTEVLVNILICAFILFTISGAFTVFQSLIYDRKRELRERESAKRDEEYHLKRMKELEK